jgi:catechol 2,3-dioxygenase-like lactoylglutathione lyase family enzyme
LRPDLPCGLQIEKINQITIPSTDVARSIEFYKRLGLIQIVESLPDYARFVCPDSDSTFSIRRVGEVAPGEKPVVYFECDDLDQTVAELEQRGVKLDSGPVDQGWLWREAYVQDPDANLICLYFAGENRLNPPWRLQRENG